MPDREKLIETFGEVAQAFGVNPATGKSYSVSYVQKLWVRHGFRLKNRIRRLGRIRMTVEELERFKDRVWKGGGKS